MDLEEDIPENHLVRVVNAAVNRLDDTISDAIYPGGYGRNQNRGECQIATPLFGAKQSANIK
ncbi:hypothetical protein PWYN_02260 [Paenibacillus wynnii]|uniref:Transposase n=1 Tax=Paenibacillus wynnii TaxID=268407 RepID=A0A098MG34_9BACL|nr:hypothetical protein PWYN_02260 [Paenibacillus wynnii]